VHGADKLRPSANNTAVEEGIFENNKTAATISGTSIVCTGRDGYSYRNRNRLKLHFRMQYRNHRESVNFVKNLNKLAF